MSEPKPPYRTAGADEALTRLLCVITEQQFSALVEQIQMLSQYGYGEVCLTWRDGHPDVIRMETSTKLLK